MLCALVFSAFAAQSASAALSGTTGFTCKLKAVEGGAGFSKAHCKTADAVASGAKYEHVAIANGTTTELTGTNELTPGEGVKNSSLKTTVAGTAIELVATGVSGTGTMSNSLVGEEHIASGATNTSATTGITYTGVTVTAPGGGVCTAEESSGVNPGMISTKPLKASTAGQGMGLKFEPASGTQFAEFFISGASCPAAVKGVQKVFGTVVTTSIDGATSNFTETQTTEQGTLRYGAATGPKAGLEGLLTLKTRANSTEAFTPLASTTTP